jgi:chromosome segregation ATPase
MSFALLFDIVVAFLLLATIIFAVLLNRKLSMIHNSRQELQALLDHFSKSLNRAEDGIIELRKAANSIGNGLDSQVKKAVALKDDLVFLIERGETLATQLEDGIRKARPSPRKSSSTIRVEPEPSLTTPTPVSLGSDESQENRLARMLEGLR